MIFVGYGDYKNYRIEQVPNVFLSELAARYKLSYRAQIRADRQDLQITIAVHEEVQRREAGGLIVERELTPKELGIKLVTKGYQALSKDHHPDRKGGNENTQKRLNTVRQELLRACHQMDDEYPEGALIIPEPGAPEISDEDIPF
jgi:hypothetical protein